MFAYCENNPIMYFDPSGHSIIGVIGFGVLIFGMVFGLTSSTPINNEKGNNIQYDSNKEPIDPNIPPNPESNYLPPKNNPNPGKVPNPNGPGRGWPSSDGGVWVPNNKQHGGPGWTVQYPGGGHQHRYPDGKIRTHNYSNYNVDMARVIVGGGLVAGTAIGIVIIFADNVTGLGVADDLALPTLFAGFTKGIQMVAG